jgi:hypothetical protein
VIDRDEVAAIARVCQEHDVIAICSSSNIAL